MALTCILSMLNGVTISGNVRFWVIDLGNPQVGIGCNDGSGGKVDTFSHKISSDSSLLAL